jgi:hypothetical protein
MVPTDLQVLTPLSFRKPSLMDAAFVRWLDAVVVRANVAITITDDGRSPDDPNPTGSAGKHSLHQRGRAVDLRSRTWTATEKWRLAAAIHALADQAPGVVEFEPVFSPSDRHWHLGVDERATAHRFVEADE